MRLIAVVKGAAQIRADLLMEIFPLAVLKDEVGAIALPQGQAAIVMVGVQGKYQNARRQERSPDGLSVVGCLDDIRCQRVHGNFPDGTGIKPCDLRMLLHQIDIAPEAVGIIVGNAVIPDFFKAAHNAEQMSP